MLVVVNDPVLVAIAVTGNVLDAAAAAAVVVEVVIVVDLRGEGGGGLGLKKFLSDFDRKFSVLSPLLTK